MLETVSHLFISFLFYGESVPVVSIIAILLCYMYLLNKTTEGMGAKPKFAAVK